VKVIDGLTNPTDIAERFADVFETACRPNNPIKNAASQYDFENRLLNYESSSNLTPFTVFEVAKCVDKLKHGKAPGLDGITVEHIVNCHPVVIVQLSCMFNCMLQLGYVPDSFGTGVILPLVKNSDGDTGSSDNYRGITLSPILSKLFELCMLLRFSDFFSLQIFILVSKRNSLVAMQFILLKKY